MNALILPIPQRLELLHDARMVAAFADQHCDQVVIEACAVLRDLGDYVDWIRADALEAAVRRPKNTNAAEPCPVPEPVRPAWLRVVDRASVIATVALVALAVAHTALRQLPDACAADPLSTTCTEAR